MKISVCIPTVRPETLPHAVQSILAQTWSNWELLIVGQGNDPDLARVAKSLVKLDERIRYLHIDERGASRARNAGLRAATGDIIAMTDDDCEAAPDWLEAISERFMLHPEVGVIGGALTAPRVSRWKLESCFSWAPAEILYDSTDRNSAAAQPAPWDWISANLALRRSVVERVGLFDDYLGAGAPDFPAAEDTDYNRRVLAAGIGVLCSPAVIVHHTYGVRRGLRQNLRNLSAYARGNAGLDGKLTLAGDPHGKESASRVLWRRLNSSLRMRRFSRIPVDVIYAVLYHKAYHTCLHDFTIGADGRLATRRCAVQSQSAPSHTVGAHR